MYRCKNWNEKTVAFSIKDTDDTCYCATGNCSILSGNSNYKSYSISNLF